MVLSNYIRLEPGVPTRMHFTDHYYMEREIADPQLGRPRTVKSHVFYVDSLGATPVSRTFSILSQKLWEHLQPFVNDRSFPEYDFIITEMGSGFLKDWNVQVIKRTGPSA